VVTVISSSAEATESLGGQWAQEVGPGWVIALTGDLGAGKTQLVRGLARGLGSPARVHSPTFNLLNIYRGGRLPVYHVDLYRLPTEGELWEAGLDAYLVTDGVTVIEWAERLGREGWPRWAPQPARLRRVWLEVTGPSERRIVYEDAGPRFFG